MGTYNTYLGLQLLGDLCFLHCGLVALGLVEDKACEVRDWFAEKVWLSILGSMTIKSWFQSTYRGFKLWTEICKPKSWPGLKCLDSSSNGKEQNGFWQWKNVWHTYINNLIKTCSDIVGFGLSYFTLSLWRKCLGPLTAPSWMGNRPLTYLVSGNHPGHNSLFTALL